MTRFLGRLTTKGPGRLARAGMGVAAVLGMVGLGMIGCARPGPGSAQTPDELLAQLNHDRAEIDQASALMMKRIEAFNASRRPGERTIQFGEVFAQDLSAEQKDVLDSMMAEEQDISYKALLQQIIADRDTVRNLQAEVARLEESLPDKFVVAQRGDTQHDLAMAFLTDEAQVEAAKAKALLDQVDQTDELLPGNKVWFFYDPAQDTFRTYVTQGEARQLPVTVRRANHRKLVGERDGFRAERDTFQSERDQARVEVADLRLIKAGLEYDIADLSRTKAELEATVAQISADLARRENSLYYHAEDERSLKDSGVLSGVLKRVRDVKGLHYDESLDLREETSITLTPEEYGLTGIEEVRVLPPIYQEGRDFTIVTAEDRGSARVVILDPELFRGKQVLFAVRG